MDKTHLPGPWRIEVDGQRAGVLAADNAMLVAEVHPVDGRGSNDPHWGDRSKANAALIRESTELLKSLKSVIDDVVGVSDESMKKIDALIARAERRSPCWGCNECWPIHIGTDGRPCHYDSRDRNGMGEHHPCTDPGLAGQWLAKEEGR